VTSVSTCDQTYEDLGLNEDLYGEFVHWDLLLQKVSLRTEVPRYTGTI